MSSKNTKIERGMETGSSSCTQNLFLTTIFQTKRSVSGKSTIQSSDQERTCRLLKSQGSHPPWPVDILETLNVPPNPLQVQRRDRVPLSTCFSSVWHCSSSSLLTVQGLPACWRFKHKQEATRERTGRPIETHPYTPEVDSQFQPRNLGATEVVVGWVCDCFRKAKPWEVKASTSKRHSTQFIFQHKSFGLRARWLSWNLTFFSDFLT